MTPPRLLRTFSPQAADRQAAEEPSPDTINKKRPRHRWERQDRLLLCLLYRFFDNPAKDYAAVFNYLFKDSLRREGFSNGLPSTTAAAQWHDMRIGSNGNDLWRRIHIEQTLAECSIRYGNIKREIENAACVLGLELCLRVQPPEVIGNHSHRLGKRAWEIEHIRGVLGDSMAAAENIEPEEERSNKLRRTRAVGDTPRTFLEAQPNAELPVTVSAPVGGATPVSAHRPLSTLQPNGEADRALRNKQPRSTNAPKALPRLLFRFSDNTSAAKGPFLKDSTGFIAGSFVNTPSAIARLPTEILRAVALIHLTPDQRISQTPFISFFSGILPPFHRALRSSSQAYVTIIDAWIAEEHLRKRFGDGKQVIYSVHNLVSEFDLKLRNGYTGPTEFLLYGMVPSEAIVGILNINDLVISSIYTHDFISVLQLELIKRNQYASGLSLKLKRLAPPLLFGTGQVVGRLLSLGNISAEYIEVLAWKIAYSWRFAGFEAAKESGNYYEYTNGVYLAWGQGRGTSINLEDQDRNQGVLEEGDDDAEYPRELDCLDAFERSRTDNHPELIPTIAESSEDEKDLIDRQFEANCPELCANHHHAFDEGEPEEAPSQPSDICEIDTRAESPCPRRGSSLDTFAKELCEVAEDGSTAPPIAHVDDWGGSPWRSVTAPRPRGALRTTIVTGQNGFFIDLSEDTEEEEDFGNAKGCVEEDTKRSAAAKRTPESGAPCDEDDDLVIVGSVDLSDT